MIIDKIYDIDLDYNYNNTNHLMTLKDYNGKYVIKIIQTINSFSPGAIKFSVVGFDVYMVIQDHRMFNYYLTKHRENVGNMELMGSLQNYNVYYDLKLKPNQVIVSDNMKETKQYIISKQRKDKLKKILKK